MIKQQVVRGAVSLVGAFVVVWVSWVVYAQSTPLQLANQNLSCLQALTRNNINADKAGCVSIAQQLVAALTPVPPPTPFTVLWQPNQSAVSLDGNPVAVSYPAPTLSGGTTPYTWSCAPIASSLFPVAVTTVNCTASDSAAPPATSAGFFTVTVTYTPPPPPGNIDVAQNFDACPDWTQASGLYSTNCPHTTGLGAGTTSGHPNGGEITAAAGMGGTGKGYRHWIGDGTNNQDGGLRFLLGRTVSEYWIRFSARWQLGFKWSTLNYSKDNYQLGSPSFTLGFHGGNAWGFQGVTGGWGSSTYAGAPGWSSGVSAGGTQSDGQFHCYEAHVKLGSAGVVETWFDNVQTASAFNLNVGSGGWSEILLGGNQAAPNNGGDMSQDFDNLAASFSGRVGCPLP